MRYVPAVGTVIVPDPSNNVSKIIISIYKVPSTSNYNQMSNQRQSDLSFKTLTQDAKLVIDKDSNLTANTVIAEGDLFVLGNIYGTVIGSEPTITVQEEGVTTSASVTTLNFVGAGVTAAGAGTVTTVTIPAAPAPTITTEDEGIPLSSTVNTLNFVGAGVTASGAGATTIITIPGAGAATNTNLWGPSDFVTQGKLWSSDFLDSIATSSIANNMVTSKIKLDVAETISNVTYSMGTNTGTFTAGQNWVGLYQNNVLVAQSADITATLQGHASDVLITIPLTAPVLLSAGFVTVALVLKTSAGNVAFAQVVHNRNIGPFSAAPNFVSTVNAGVTSLPANLNATTAWNTMMIAILS
jgi:hypothetical protein